MKRKTPYFEIVIAIVAIAAFLYLVVAMILLAVSKDECLQKGFPNSSITYKMDTYCIGLDGAVRNRIESTDGTKRFSR